MIAQGFKPVGWVAAVAGAALGCYMVSLNVASERSELASIERKIIAAKRDIRLLETELGTRGRYAQLDRWNAEVLALSAPTTAQLLDNPVLLARLDQRRPSFEEQAKVRMASFETTESAKPKIVQAGAATVAPAPLAAPAQPLVRQASFTAVEAQPVPVVKKAALIDANLAAAIGEAAKEEQKDGATGGQ